MNITPSRIADGSVFTFAILRTLYTLFESVRETVAHDAPTLPSLLLACLNWHRCCDVVRLASGGLGVVRLASGRLGIARYQLEYYVYF